MPFLSFVHRHFYLHLIPGFGGGSRPRRRGPERGDDIKQTVNISFEEAAFGKKASIKVNRSEECNECHGSGAKPGTSKKPHNNLF